MNSLLNITAAMELIHSRRNWTFFGSDNGGKTTSVLLSFIATSKRNTVELFRSRVGGAEK